MARNQTFQEWLAIHKDLDAYIARGGKLSELNLLDEATHKRLESLIAAELSKATLARLSRFFRSIMDTMNRKRPVGEVLTESKLQELWRRTASHKKPLH
jgi:cytochrome P450